MGKAVQIWQVAQVEELFCSIAVFMGWHLRLLALNYSRNEEALAPRPPPGVTQDPRRSQIGGFEPWP
jgi:hypothetical protein